MWRALLEPLAFFVAPFAIYVIYLLARGRHPLKPAHWPGAAVVSLTIAGLVVAIAGMLYFGFGAKGQGERRGLVRGTARSRAAGTAPSRAAAARSGGGLLEGRCDGQRQALRRHRAVRRHGAGKRLLVYGAVVAVIFVAVVAFLTVVTNYDNRDQPLKNTAPWAVSDNTEPPRDVDFKANGPRVPAAVRQRHHHAGRRDPQPLKRRFVSPGPR